MMTADNQIPLIAPMPKHDDQSEVTVRVLTIPSAYREIPESNRLDLNLFRLIDGEYTPEEIRRIHSLPRFEITALVQDIPKELLSLPPCSEVVLRSSSSDDVITVENAIRKFRRIISPPDRLTVFEAVGLLERCGIQPPPTGKTHGPFRIDPVQWLCREVEAGRLVFNDHGRLRIEPGKYAGHFGMYGETTSRKELNAWLERIGHLHRIPEPVAPSVAAVAPTPAPSASAPAVALPEPVADPAEAVPVSAGIVRHAIKARRDPLASVFARAMQEATDSACPHSVWAALVAMATGNAAPPELTDYREDKGLQATGARGGWLSKSAFLDRWRRGSVQPRQPALSRANTR